MTLTPTWLPVTGVEGKPAPRNEMCAMPMCRDRSAHGHHVYPRSHMRGEPYEWVRLPDDRIVGNTIGLCFAHHEAVTGGPGGHRARLDWHDGDLAWIAIHPDGTYDRVGPLDPQPLSADAPRETPHPHAAHLVRSHTHLAPGQSCPTCGYQRPQERQPGPKRARQSWGVTVPADAELGAEILDGWVEQFAAVMGLEGTKGLVRYHVLAVVLAWADQNMSQFIHDVKESGEA